MAYADALDPTKPTDADLISSGDDEIRKLKRAIIQRLSTIVVNLDADPLVLKDSVFPDPTPAVTPGLLSSRPNPPTAQFTQYYATDTDQLFVSRDSVVTPGTLEWIEAKKTQISEPIVLAYSAGEARFAPDGTETRARRVQSAIAAARLGSSPVKVVYVPKSLWGYGGDLDYSTSMFDSSIMMVREGALDAWFDPVAYGADPTGVVNSHAAIDTAFLHASTSTFGMRMVAFTVAGNYLNTTNVDQRGCALLLGPGAVLTGGGNLTGTQAFKIPPDPPAPTPPVDAAFTYNPAAAAGSRAAQVTVSKRLLLRIPPTSTDSSGVLTVVMSDSSFGPAGTYDLAKLHTIVASERGAAADGPEIARITVNAGTQTITLDLDGGVQTAAWDIYMVFTT
jgi:hypothetical protein